MKFNHDAEDMHKALGIDKTAEQISEEITQVVKSWALDKDAHSKTSKLAERIHEGLSYEIILYLATREVFRKFEETLRDAELMKKVMKEVLDLLDKEDEQDNSHLN